MTLSEKKKGYDLTLTLNPKCRPSQVTTPFYLDSHLPQHPTAPLLLLTSTRNVGSHIVTHSQLVISGTNLVTQIVASGSTSSSTSHAIFNQVFLAGIRLIQMPIIELNSQKNRSRSCELKKYLVLETWKVLLIWPRNRILLPLKDTKRMCHLQQNSALIASMPDDVKTEG
ncbi:uncharacterized protein LOC141655219 [Silene latifolia]|uniref:uncharacterized protein LOC141655219 n=1 Tax=Silene latifolia TaxID=37657 RepID=UPI003D789CC5